MYALCNISIINFFSKYLFYIYWELVSISAPGKINATEALSITALNNQIKDKFLRFQVCVLLKKIWKEREDEEIYWLAF